MKRDLNLIRDLLMIIENADSPRGRHVGVNASGPRVQHHLRLLVDAGFVRGVGETADGAISVRLTWNGCEFLELIRDDATWHRVKSYVERKTKGTNVSVLQAALCQQANQMVQKLDRLRIDQASGRRTGWTDGSENDNGNGHRVDSRRFDKPDLSDPPSPPPLPVPSPMTSTQFQFHVWNGEVDSLPIHLL